MKWSEINPSTRASIVKWGLIALCVVAVLCYLRFAPDSLKPWTNKPEPAVQTTEPKPLAKVERIYIPGPERVRVIETIHYIEKMPGVLTQATMQDNSSHVIASANIPPSPAGGIATGILKWGSDNVAVGSIEYHAATPPFFAIQKEFGVRAGMGTGGLVLGEVYVHPLRMGPINIEGRGFVNRDNARGADFGAAVLVDYRF